MSNYMTEDELNALQSSGLDRYSPFSIMGVSNGFFSVARHYGGATYKGRNYIYMPESDELVRDDVVRWMHKRWKDKQNKLSVEAENKQSGLF